MNLAIDDCQMYQIGCAIINDLLELSAEDRDFAAYGRYVFENNHGKDGWWYKQFKKEAPDNRNDETLP